MRRRFLGIGLGILCFAGVLYGLTATTHLLEVRSQSLEDVLYLLVVKSKTFKRGDLVFIQGHAAKYVGEGPFAKRIIGLPGDLITRTHQGIGVKSKSSSITTTFPLLTETKDKKALTPLPIRTIPAGFVFVAGDHPRSFDSRYGEFGLVKAEHIQGKALWSW